MCRDIVDSFSVSSCITTLERERHFASKTRTPCATKPFNSIVEYYVEYERKQTKTKIDFSLSIALLQNHHISRSPSRDRPLWMTPMFLCHVAENGEKTATVALFCDSVDRA